ncbi:MFS transporter [Winogradskyella psychrotolerans]|uniref:MFS transporter n=1 Tax=Winogradskyella psychrotolerans TaxID=1344585 RepID=UPI001C06670E|nr:MFS transporter [Winogradskyella psychrotolerans]MBU2930009.1 MFS transporter [Winogradskyella psychrotolerans]
MSEFKKGSKKLLNAWAFYDWANSVYTLTIASSIFPLFYSSLFDSKETLVSAFGFTMKQETLITIVTAFTFLVVAVLSPILSGIADYVGNKKNFMKFFCYVGSIGCIGLYWFNLSFIHFSLLFYFMGLIGYWGSLVFYNSYLPDIAFEDQQDSISAKGFSMGYIGSVLLLIANLIMVMTQEEDADKIEMMRYSFITVGVWWALFSQYTFRILPNGVSSGHKVTKDVVFNGFKELKAVWVQLKQNLRLKRYLNAFFVFSMAVQTIMLMAVYFGEKEINWASDGEKTIGLIVSILVIQLVAILGAILTSRAASKFGNISTLIVINFMWMCLCVYAYFMVSPIQFYIAAGLVGLVMGGVQSLGRSTYSKYLPETEDTTSYFSFYDVAEKIGIVIGMFIFAFVSEYSSMRYAILFLFVFFLIGIILLFRVPKEE